MMKIRFAALDDAAALSEIYAQYTSLPISFEYVAPSPDEFRRRMAVIGAFYPYPVCELDGRIAGYGLRAPLSRTGGVRLGRRVVRVRR